MNVVLTLDSSSSSTRAQKSGVDTAWINHTSQGSESGSFLCWTHEDGGEYCVDEPDDVSV